MKQEEKKTHGYTWEIFKECIKLEFISKNSNYISKCKLRDFVNVTNDNLRQYVRAYSELMLVIRHMHELDRVCHFAMGLPTWAKHKLEENRPVSLSKAIMKVEGFLDVGYGEKLGFKKDNKFPPKKACHEGNGTEGKISPKGKGPNNFKAWVSNPKEISSRKRFFSKWANPREMLVGSPKERVSTVMKWGITPKIAPNPNWGMGVSKIIAFIANLAQGECNRFIFLKGKVSKRYVLCLLDTGASHNFITQECVERMEFWLEELKAPIEVHFADGVPHPITWQAKDVPLQLGNWKRKVDLLVSTIGGWIAFWEWNSSPITTCS